MIFIQPSKSTGSNEKIVKPPFDRIYKLLEFFHPKDKRVLWRILIEQLYLYNAIKEVYQTKEMKPIKRLNDEQLKDFRAIQKDQLHARDPIEKLLKDVIEHLTDQPELKDLIDEKASSVS